jgi:TolB-like protein
MATDLLGSKTPAARPVEVSRNRRRAVSGLKKLSSAWWFTPAIGLLGLMFAWHSVRSLIGSRDRAPAEPSIAVLPFENISPNQEDGYFADGVQDEVLRNLAGIAQIKVISRTSVMQYRGDFRKVANALGVTNVLEGTVYRDGNRVRVSTALVDARSDNLIWMDSYDRELTDVFAIQSDIAQQIAAKLSARFGAGRRAKEP